MKAIKKLMKRAFFSSRNYWDYRYSNGGDSGDGSYGKLAKFKADFINEFIRYYHIDGVIEYGCGDGNQLALFKGYAFYMGYDVSPAAIEHCELMFHNDFDKTFALMDDKKPYIAQLTLSLDVIYHLVEDKVFEEYMHRLFDSSSKYVIIYSSDTEKKSKALHVKHRKFTRWVKENKPEFKLIMIEYNKYHQESHSDFYVYQKI